MRQTIITRGPQPQAFSLLTPTYLDVKWGTTRYLRDNWLPLTGRAYVVSLVC